MATITTPTALKLKLISQLWKWASAVKFVLILMLGFSGWVCVSSATNRAGWSLPTAWWGTATHKVVAGKALSRNDTVEALESARLLLYHDPVGRSSASILAEALLLAGQTRASGQAFQLALANGWRDPEAQVWALEAALDNQDHDQAAAHLDALLRITPQVPLKPHWLAQIEKSPDGKTALAERLARSPLWSNKWLRSSADLPKSRLADRIEALQLALNGGLIVTKYEAAAISRLLIDRHPDYALAFWNEIVGRGDSATRGIWDADFVRSAPEKGIGPFEWRRVDATGARIEAADQVEGAGLEISNLSIATTTLVETLIALEPGVWRLSWQQAGSANLRVVPNCLTGGFLTAPTLLRSTTGKALRFSMTASCPIQKISIVSTGENVSSSRGKIFGIRVVRDDLSSSITGTKLDANSEQIPRN